MSEERQADRRRSLLTIPNVLSAIRILGAPGLVFLGGTGRGDEFLALFLFLMATDWIDGKLAVWLDQRSSLGARLDSAADIVMYGSLLVGLVWLEGSILAGEWPWIAAGCASWALSALAGLMKFGKLASYHTRLAKASWLLALLATLALLGWEMIWPFRAAAASVTLTNLEGLAITSVLSESRTDVPSVFQALGGPERAGHGRGSGPS